MKIAVLTLTRDRLDYTKHCFQTLRDNSGCDFDHYILDQNSQDGTQEWLLADETLNLLLLDANVGICVGLNLMLDEMVEAADYDVIVRFDNDCEVVQPDTLKTVAELAYEHQAILAPKVLGLINPPPVLSVRTLGDHTVDVTPILGGIFMAIPASLFSQHGYRYDTSHKLATGDEAIVPWWRGKGGTCGYVRGVEVNHYETTVGQQARYPEYHARKLAEMAA